VLKSLICRQISATYLPKTMSITTEAT